MALSSNPYFTFNLIVFFIAQILQIAVSQSNSPPPPSPADSCNGIFVSYAYTSGSKIRPFLAAPARQPYRFESTITVLNNGLDELKSWRVFVGFKHNEYLVSASSAVLADGNSLPGNVGNGTVFSGYPSSDLMSAVETAGDVTQMQAQIDLVGTVFGVGPPSVPMPSNISLANDGFKCPKPTMQGKNQMQVCCVKDANSTSNVIKADKFLPRQNGDLTIMYDVLRTYESNYYAQVTIENQNTLGRLDNWRLSWQWMRDEFIFAMQGAYPSVVDYSNCIFGPQGQYYKALDFSTILNCERRPTIIDLPPTKYNDTKLGLKPSCCRNGTILPRWMDPSKSISIFQLNVYKMPPDLNSSELNPPQNFQISGTLNPDYACGPPIRVTPSQFPDPSGLPLNSTAISSWQVVCNITQPKKASPKCCVSFSAYYNESVVPCKTCACGGCQNNKAKTCNATAPAILLPPEALLVPFENRTAMAVAWAGLKHRTVPNPLPCADNCGVSINWHLYTDFNKGWSARVTLFNWGDVNFADWFAAVQMDKAAAGFERMYSFNGSIVEDVDETIFMQGLTGLNYLVAETDGINSSNGLRVPGKQQSVISFTKKGITGINVAGGEGFPKKVFFNGEECSLPSIYPVSSGPRKSSTLAAISVLTALFILLIQK